MTTTPTSTMPSTIDALDATRLITIDEARDRLRISRWSIYQLINQQQLKTITIGSRRLITPQDFEAFLQSRRT